jgi:hypothetical protein
MSESSDVRSAREDILARAVRNNAAWCDTVCCYHGRVCSVSADLWMCPEPTPRFYPNLITLTSARGLAAQRAAIAALVAADLPRPWGVKDSYAALDLAPLGFRPLFDATWLSRPAHLAPPVHTPTSINWEYVRTDEGLAEWEAAWSGAEGTLETRIFLPALLVNPTVTIIAGRRGGSIVAGAMANRSDGVVGISNLFVPSRDEHTLRAELLAAIVPLFPDSMLVGYEHGSELASMQTLGFEALGPLRVWELGGA